MRVDFAEIFSTNLGDEESHFFTAVLAIILYLTRCQLCGIIDCINYGVM